MVLTKAHLDAETYHQASIKTANDLRTVATSDELRQLSRLSLPEIEALSHEIARVIPAGNVPGIILSGLARLDGRKVSAADSGRHIGLLFKGVRQMMDKAVYSAFFAGPVAILCGYQQLLKLSGKDPMTAFPEGTWQFYLEFALREDSARHTNETLGFHQQLQAHHLKLKEVDLLSSWVLTAAHFLQQLPDILAVEWYERVATTLLAATAAEYDVNGNYANLYDVWLVQRPYQRNADAGQRTYPEYRQVLFDTFLTPYIDNLPEVAQSRFRQQLAETQDQHLPNYQQQMSWLAYLEPSSYRETRIHYLLEEAAIGVIWQDRYYLIPFSEALNPDTVRTVAASILTKPVMQFPALLDDMLVLTHRNVQPDLRAMLDPKTAEEIHRIQRTPILINWDERDFQQELAAIRRGKRGIGDHALTIFRTDQSIVFDQSHIFFDGVWGAAVAEIMTNEALSWAGYLTQLAPASPNVNAPYSPTLPLSKLRFQSAMIPAETSAENIDLNLKALLGLRRLLKQRSDLASITVNDLLLLYRSIHSQCYQPSPRLQAALAALAEDSREEAQNTCKLICQLFQDMNDKNPAILIPIDASRHNPRDRIFPTTFRNPLTNFYAQHVRCIEALQGYKQGQGNRDTAFKTFHEAQLNYLRLIGGFGALLARYREVALSGQSTSTASIRALGHLPESLQKLLDTIPGQFDVLNEIIKGEEVFSNMGRVASGSTLHRFITAKDDNEQKSLAWGILTDAQGILHLSLRDFRPHVTRLVGLNMEALAQQIAQDHLDSYVDGLNRYVGELRSIVIASRETTVSREN